MIRMFDYECPTHGVFEAMLTSEQIAESMECPLALCGAIAPRVWRTAPGMQPSGVHAIEVAGHTYRREDMEAFLDSPAPKETPFFKKPEFKGRFRETVSRLTKQELAGELAPQHVDAATMKQLEKSTAATNVDVDKVKAGQQHFVETFRKTDLQE